MSYTDNEDEHSATPPPQMEPVGNNEQSDETQLPNIDQQSDKPKDLYEELFEELSNIDETQLDMSLMPTANGSFGNVYLIFLLYTSLIQL